MPLLIVGRLTRSVDYEYVSNKRVKVNKWLRNVVSQKRLYSLMMCSIHSNSINELNMYELMSSEENRMRERRFFHLIKSTIY